MTFYKHPVRLIDDIAVRRWAIYFNFCLFSACSLCWVRENLYPISSSYSLIPEVTAVFTALRVFAICSRKILATSIVVVLGLIPVCVNTVRTFGYSSLDHASDSFAHIPQVLLSHSIYLSIHWAATRCMCPGGTRPRSHACFPSVSGSINQNAIKYWVKWCLICRRTSIATLYLYYSCWVNIRVVLLLCRISAIVMDIVILVITWHATFKTWREGRRLNITMSFCTCLLRDGAHHFMFSKLWHRSRAPGHRHSILFVCT